MSRGNPGRELGPVSNAGEEERTTSLELSRDSQSKNMEISKWIARNHPLPHEERKIGDCPPPPPPFDLPPAPSQSDLRLSLKVVDRTPPVSSSSSSSPLGIVSSGCSRPHPCPSHPNTGAVLPKTGPKISTSPPPHGGSSATTDEERSFQANLPDMSSPPIKIGSSPPPRRPPRPLSLRLPDPRTDVLSSSSSSSTLSPFNGSPIAAHKLTATAGGSRSPSHARFINRHKYREKTPAVESATCFSFLEFATRLSNLDCFLGEGLLGPVQGLCRRWKILPPCDMQRCRFPELFRVYRYRVFFFLFLACISLVIHQASGCCLSVIVSLTFASLWVAIGAMMCCSKTYKWTSNLLTGVFTICLVSTHPWLVSIRETLPFSESLHIFVGCAFLLILPQADQWVIRTHTRVLCHLTTTFLYVLSCVFSPYTSSPSSSLSDSGGAASSSSSSSSPSPVYTCTGALFWWIAHLLFYCSDFFLSEIFALSCMSEAEEASNFMVEQLFKCWSPGGINVVALTDKHRQCTWISKDAHQVFAPEVQQQAQRGAGGAGGKPTTHHLYSSDRGSSRNACDELQGKGLFDTARNGGWKRSSDHDPTLGIESDGLPLSSPSACRGFLTKRRSSYHNLSSLPNSPCLSSSASSMIKKSETISPEVEIHSCSSSSFSPSNPSSFHLDSPSPGETPSSRSSPAKCLFDGRPETSLTHERASVSTDEDEESNGKTPYRTRKKKAFFKFIRQFFTFQKIRSLLLSHFTPSSYSDHHSLGRFSPYPNFVHQEPHPAHYYSSLFSLFDLVVSKIAYLFRRLAVLTPSRPYHRWLTGQKESPSQSFLQQHVQATTKTEGERADAALIGLSLDTWIHPDDRAVFAAIFERADGDTPGTPEFHYADSTPQSKPSPAKLLAELARRRLGAVASSSCSSSSAPGGAPSSGRRETTAAGLLQEDGRCIVRVLRPSSRLAGGGVGGREEMKRRGGKEYGDLSLHSNNEGGLSSSPSCYDGDQTLNSYRRKGSCSVILSPSRHKLSHSQGGRCPRREYDEEIRGGGPGRDEGGQPSFSSLAFSPCRDEEHRRYSDNDYLYYEVSVTPCRYPWTSSRVRLTRYNVSFYNIDERVRLQKQLESLVLAMSETLGIAAWAFDTHSDHSGCRKSRAKQGDEERGDDHHGDKGRRGSHRSSLESEDGDSEEDGSLSRPSLSPSNGLHKAALGGNGGLFLNQEEEKRRGELCKKTVCTPTNKEPLLSSSPSAIPGYGSPSRYSYIFTEQAYKKMTGREISTTEQMRLFQAGSALWYVHANRRQTRHAHPSSTAGDTRRITRSHESKKGRLGRAGDISSTDGKGSDLLCEGGEKIKTPLLHNGEEVSKKTPNLIEIHSKRGQQEVGDHKIKGRSAEISSSFAAHHAGTMVQQEERGLELREEGDVDEGMSSLQHTERDKRRTNQLYSREGGDHHHHPFDQKEFMKGKEDDGDERGDDDYEAALQGTWLQYFMEPGRGRLIQALKELFEEKKPFKLELPYERADGEMRWFKVAGYASSDSSLFWGLIQDATTDRTQLNEEERSRALLTLLTDCQFSGWGVADIGFETEQIIEASTSLNRLFGRDVKGHHYSIVIPSDVIPQLEAEGYCSEYKVALRVNHDHTRKKETDGEDEGGRGEEGEESSSCDQSCLMVPRSPHPPQRKLMSLTAVADPSDPSIAVFGVKELQQEGQGRAHPLSLLTDCQFDGWGVADIFETEQIIEASSSLNRLLRRDVRGLHYCIVIPPTVIPQLEAEGWCFEHPVVLRDLCEESHYHCYESNCPHERNGEETREKESHTTEREEERGRDRTGGSSCCHGASDGKKEGEEEEGREGGDEIKRIGERTRSRRREEEEDKRCQRDGNDDGEEQHSYRVSIEGKQKGEGRGLQEREEERHVDHCRHTTTHGEKKEDEEERSCSSPSSPCTCTHHQAAHPQSRVMALTAVVDPTDGSLVVFGLRDLHMTYQEALIELHSRDHTTSQEGENGGGGEGHPRTTRSSPYSSSSPFPLPASSSSCSTYPSITHPSEHHHTREEDALDGTREAGVIEGRPSILPQVCTTTGNLSSKLSASSEDAVRKFDGVDGRKDGSLHDHPVSGGPSSEGLSSSSSSSTSSPMAIPTSVEKKNQQSLDQREEDKSKESRGSGWMYTGEKKGDETTQAIPSMCRIEGKNDGEVREKEGESSSSSFTCRCHHFYYESRTGGCQERLEGGRLVQGEDPNARGARQEGHHHPHQHVLPGVHTPYPTNTPQGHSNKTTDMSAFFSSSPFPPPHTSMTREEESLQDSSSSLTIPQHRHELASSSSSLSRVEAEKTLTEFEIVPRPIEEEKEKEKSCFCCSCHPYHQENDGIHTSSASHGKEEESKGALFRHKDLYIGLNHPASQSSSHFYSSSPYPSSQHHPLFLSEVAGLPRHPHQGKGGGGELQTTGSGGEYTSHSVSGSSWNDRSSRSGNHRTSEGTQESSSASREDDEALPHPFSKIGNSKRMSPSSRVMSASSLHHRLSLSSASSLIPGVFSRSERRRKEEEEREGKEVRKSSSSSFSPLFSYSALSRTVALRRISTASSSSYPSYLSPGSCQTDSWPYHRRRGLFTERRCPFGPRRSYCSTSAAPGVVAEEKGRGKEGRSRRRLLHPSSSSLSRQEERSHQSEELSDTIRSSHSKASSTSSSVARSLPIALSLCYPSNIPSASSSSVCSSLSSASSSIAAAQSLKAMDSLEAAFHRYYRRSSSSSYHHDQQKSHVRGKNGGTRGEECQGGRRGVLAKQRCSREEVEEQQRHQHHERVSKKKMEKAQEEGCEMSVENEREMTERQRRVGSIGGRLYSQKASPRSTTKENTKSSLSSLSSDKIQNTRRGRERERRQEDDGDLIHRREDEAHKGSYPPPQQMMKVTCAEERRKTLACAKEKEIQEGQTRKTECIPVEDGLDPALFPRSRFLNNGREDQERRQRSGPFNSSSGCTGGGGGVQITPSFTGEATSVSRPLGGFENNFLSFKGKEEEEKKRTGKEEDNGEEKKKKENRTGGESGEGGDHLKKRMIAIPLDQDRQGNHHVLHLQHLDKIEEACIHSSQIDKGELSIEDERQANICNLEDRKTPMGNLFIDRPEKDRGISFTSNTQHDKERDGVCMSHQGELLRRDQHQPQEEGEPCIKQETFLLPVTAISSSSSSVSPHPVNPAVSSFSSSSCASSSSSSPLRRPSLLSSPVFRGSSANSAGSSEILFDATALSPYIMPRRSDHLLEEEEPPHNNSSKIHGPDANGGVCTLRLYSSEGDRGEAEEAALPAPRSPLQDLDHVEEGERTVLPNQKDLEEEEGDRHDSSNGNKGISDEKKERRTTAKSNRIMTIEAEEDIVKQHLDERTRLQGGVAVGGLDRQSQVVDDEERQKNRRQTNSGQAKLHSSLPNLRGRMRGLHHEGDEEIVRKEEEEQHRCEECHDDRLHCGHLSHHHHRLPGESIQLQDRERYHRLLAGSQSSSSSSLPSSSSCCLKHCHHPFHHISRRPSLPQLPSDVGEISHQDPRCYYYHPKDFTGQPQVYRSSPPPPLADLRPFSQCPSASLHLHPNPRLVPLPKVDQYEPSLHTCTSSSSSSSLSPPGARPRSAAVIARGHTTTCFSSLRSLSKDVFISSNPLAPSEERRREGRETHEKNEGGEIGHPFFHLAPPSRAVTITPPTAAMLVERQCGQIIHPVACRSSDGGGDASPSSSAPPSASERSP